eukprot:6188850-Pleurochrysis_carterae.AAC.2
MVGYQRTSTFLVPDAAYTSESPFIEQQAARLLRTRCARISCSRRVSLRALPFAPSAALSRSPLHGAAFNVPFAV